ncbi:hypothetical protein MRB53_040215 [Persea americana]|nr:hypothetical protein MRB53_040215 [Persea americana]
MPSFIKDLSLRRKSKASIKTDTDPTAQSFNNGKPSTRRNKSSSTLSSIFDKTTPPTPLSSMSHTTLPTTTDGISPTPPPIPGNRPRLTTQNTNPKRYSLANVHESEGVVRATPATSPLAPKVLSVSDGSWVHQKVLLIFGTCADTQQPVDGSLTVHHHQDNFPAQMWPVNDSHFKALVYLQPGPNRLRLDFSSPHVQNNTTHSSWLNINFLPLISAPPIQLCIILGKDSPGTYDAVPDRAEKEGNDLKQAIRKFRMAAYLWQAFTGEQMNRNGLGRRCFRYEEEWQPGTLSYRDVETGQMRNEAKIHVIRSDRTVDEIRDLDLAQQHHGARRNGDLFNVAMDAARQHFKPQNGRRQYVSCLFLDAHWDKEVGTIRGHAALGGGDGTVQLAIFGGQAIQSYPSHLEEVVPAFTDCTKTDTNYVANDANESGSNWEAVNIGIGAHLHETGHLLGCPHQESGVMLRDYTRLHRTFLTREEYSTRTNESGMRLVLPHDECAWHRLDALRFRYHPCFQIPSDTTPPSDTAVRVWSVDNSTLLISSGAGIAWIEIMPEGDIECHHWLEYSDHQPSAPNAPRQIALTEQALREKLPEDKRKKKLKITIFSLHRRIS